MTTTEPYGPESDVDGNVIARLAARIDLTLGTVRDGMGALAHVIRDSAPPQPVWHREARDAFANAAGVALLRLHGPDQGRLWLVHSITVGGVTRATVAGGQADVYVTSMDLVAIQASLANLPLFDWRDNAQTLPLSAFYSDGQMVLRGGEELFVVVTGATVGQQYVAAVEAEDIRDGNLPQAWSL